MTSAPRVLILSSALDSSPRAVDLARPMTVGEIVAAENVTLSLPTIAVLTDPLGNSRPVMRGEWHVRQVTAGHQLAFVPVPGRGSLSSILAAVAGIALAIVAPWAAGAIVGAMGLTGTAATIATSVISGAIMIAGQFIINRLLGPPQQISAESVFSARASNNRAMPLEPIPSLYGLMRYAPPYAARPYAEFVDNDQYLYQLHCLTVGHADPLKWEIGETLVWTKAEGFQGTFAGGDAEIEIIRPGDEIKLFPANVVVASTVDGQQVPDSPEWLGPFAVSAPGIKVSRIVCDYVFPLGLIHIDKKGRGVAMTRTVKAEYRRINDAGAPLGSWETLIDFEHRAATRTPQRISRGLDVPEDRYEVRFGASGTDLSDNTGKTSTLNRVLWAGLRGYVTGFQTPPGCTLVATKIRATENLSREAAGQYLWTCQRLLPVWSEGSGWSAPVATRSPAWAAADLLSRLDVPDTDYDLGWLATYAGIWQTRGDRFDAVFDRRWQASEALDAILRVGRSYHVRLGWMIGFVRDEPRQVRRMAFTPDTVLRGSIQREDIWFSEDQPDSLKVVYLDGETWRERDVMAAIGAIGDGKPQEQPAFGITNHDHAWREGIFTAAENAFRRSFRTFQVEREGRMLVRGDPVVLHDPLLDVVLFESEDSPGRKIDFARLMERDGDTLTLDRGIVVEPGENYHATLRDRYGREWGPCLVQSLDGSTVVLDSADRAIVEAQHGVLADVMPDVSRQELAHVTLLKGDYRLFDGVVLEARPLGPDNWEITIVNDDQRVHAVDQTEPMPAPWTPPAMLAPPPESPVVRGVHALLQQGTLSLTLEAGWQPAPGADRYLAEISYDEDAAADPAAATWTPVHDSRATRLSVPAMPQPLTLRVGGVGKVQGAWTYREVVAVPELRLPDEVVDPLIAEVGELLDWSREDGPLHPLWLDIEDIDEKVGVIQSELAGILGADEYDPLQTYLEGALVKFDGGLYRAIQNVPVSTPPSDPAYWEKIGDYTSLGETVAALTGRVDDAESEIEKTAEGFRVTARDSRRIYTALMSDAIGEIDKTGAAIMDARDRLDAAAVAARWTETEISRVDGVLTVHAADIAMVQALLGTKADVSVTQAMQATITEHGDLLTSHGGLITSIQNTLPDKADVTVLNALSGTVTSQGGVIAAQGSAITSLESALNGYMGVDAVATALSQRYTKTETDAEIDAAATALAGLIESVEAQVGAATAGFTLKAEAMASPGDSWVRAGLRLSANDGVTFEEAAILLDARTTGSVRSRIVLKAAQTAFMDASGNVIGLFAADGLTMENIWLGTLKFNRLESHDGKLVISGGSGGTYIRMST